jgi:hypothetical protein
MSYARSHALCQRDLIVDLLLRIEDDDMGVMNVVAQGFVQCCKRQLGCVSFFENTKIIKKIELLLLSRSRCASEPISYRSPLRFTSPSDPPLHYIRQTRF